mgnify:CR=1 FL=1
MSVYFVVISSFEGFISEEIHVLELLEEAEAVGLVPSLWENIETDLAANRELKIEVRELLLEGFNEFLSNLVLFVVSLVLIAFFLVAVSSNRAHVDQACSVFNEGASFDWDVQVSDVFQAEIDKLLESIFSELVFDALDGEHFPFLQRIETVLRESKVHGIDDFFSDLLFDFLKIGASNDSDVMFLLESFERVDHVLLNWVSWLCQSAIDVEKHDNILSACIFH